MFHLETEFFSWNFMVWAINFLLAVLLVIVIAFVLRRRINLTLAESEECGPEEMQLYMPIFERYLKMLRIYVIDVWSGYSWLLTLSPLFFLLLFLTAVRA